MIDSDHGFHNFVKIPGNYNAFFHVLLTPDLRGSLVQVLL